MSRQLRLTEDGSYTLFVPELEEHYHSINGALSESLHVYIQAGLLPLLKNCSSIHILDIGLGTGLNLLLSEVFTRENIEVFYTAIEPYPLTSEEIKQLNYAEIYPAISQELLLKTHELQADNHYSSLRNQFNVKVIHALLQSLELEENVYDMVYFDAFSPDVQTELWQKSVFDNLFKSMKKEGVLCTYSAKGIVRRRMEKAGFTVERLPGFAGKREMLRAIKR